MKTMSRWVKQIGISLLEVLLSLAIIAIILVMAMQYFSTASDNQKLNMVRAFLGADSAAIQSYGINNNGYTDLSWDTLVDKGYLSASIKNLDCTGESCMQKTPWGGDVTIGQQSTTAGDAVTLSFVVPNEKLCQNLADTYGSDVLVCATNSVTFYASGAPSSES